MRRCFLILLFWGLGSTYGYAGAAVFFTPSDSCEQQIIRLINRSERQIRIAIYSLTNDMIAGALDKAHKRGVDVYILTDRLQASHKSSQIPKLYQTGIHTQIQLRYRTEHNKFAVFDNKIVVTGSYNWTKAASRRNSENCLFLWNEPDIITKYISRFDYLWRLNNAEVSRQWLDKRLENASF